MTSAETSPPSSTGARSPGLVLELVVSPVFGASCWIVGAGPGSACVVVDAGALVADRVHDVVRARAWEPVAVLATHGHLDHTFDTAEIAATYDVPVRLHAADAYRLEDPFGTIEAPGTSGALTAALRSQGADPARYRTPSRIETFDADGSTLPGLDGLGVRALHSPGHTQGSTLYLVDDVDVSAVEPPARGTTGPVPRYDLVLTGDVLFAGTIGRTDLPGGDGATMLATLRDVVGHAGTDRGLDAHRLVLPGHGPVSTVAAERRTNPFLRG